MMMDLMFLIINLVLVHKYTTNSLTYSLPYHVSKYRSLSRNSLESFPRTGVILTRKLRTTVHKYLKWVENAIRKL